jgi:hypothetical protein
MFMQINFSQIFNQNELPEQIENKLKNEPVCYASPGWTTRAESLIRSIKRECTQEHLSQFQILIKEDKENVRLKISEAKGNLLHSLAKFGKPLEFVNILVEQGSSINEQDDWGNTPLLWAIANANNEIAYEILKYKQNINLQDSMSYRNTALHLAIAKGYQNVSLDGQRLKISNLKLIKQILELGADVNLQNGNGNTPLHLACLRRDIWMVKAILKKNPNIQMCNNEGKNCIEMLQKTYGEALKIFEDTTGAAYLLKRGDFDAGKKEIQLIFSEINKT